MPMPDHTSSPQHGMGGEQYDHEYHQLRGAKDFIISGGTFIAGGAPPAPSTGVGRSYNSVLENASQFHISSGTFIAGAVQSRNLAEEVARGLQYPQRSGPGFHLGQDHDLHRYPGSTGGGGWQGPVGVYNFNTPNNDNRFGGDGNQSHGSNQHGWNYHGMAAPTNMGYPRYPINDYENMSHGAPHTNNLPYYQHNMYAPASTGSPNDPFVPPQDHQSPYGPPRDVQHSPITTSNANRNHQQQGPDNINRQQEVPIHVRTPSPSSIQEENTMSHVHFGNVNLNASNAYAHASTSDNARYIHPTPPSSIHAPRQDPNRAQVDEDRDGQDVIPPSRKSKFTMWRSKKRS